MKKQQVRPQPQPRQFMSGLGDEFGGWSRRKGALKKFMASAEFAALPDIDQADLRLLATHLDGCHLALLRLVSRQCGAV